MSSDLISIIMPVYNVEKYVGAAIHSVLNQSYKHFELIIVDDCSLDKSIDAINPFTDSRIRVIRLKKNQGVAFARNLAIAESKGGYLAFLDSDDVMNQHRLKKQVAFMKRQPEIALCGGRARTISLENRISRYIDKMVIDPKAVNSTLVFGNIFCTSTIMMRREAMPTGGFRQRYAEDYDFLVRVAEKHQLGIASDIFADYRIRPGSAMHTYAIENKKRDVWESQAPLFDALKISPTAQEKEIHLFTRTNAGNVDREQLLAIYDWYMRLIEANRQAKVYPENAFKLAASYMWFSHLFRATGCGSAALGMFFGRSLSLAHPQPVSRMAKFVVKATIRRKLVRGGKITA